MDYPHWLLHGLLISICLKHKWGERNVFDGPVLQPEQRTQSSSIISNRLRPFRTTSWYRDGGYFRSCRMKRDESLKVQVMSNSKEGVHMCKISQLITGCCDSWHTSLHLPVYQRMFFFSLSPPRLPVLQARQGHLKEMIPLHHKIYERFTPVCLPVYRIHWLPPRSCSRPRWFTKQEPIYWVSQRAWAQQRACLQWQALIENQTQVASSLKLKASLWPSVSTLARITLDADTKSGIIRWHVTIKKCDSVHCGADSWLNLSSYDS